MCVSRSSVVILAVLAGTIALFEHVAVAPGGQVHSNANASRDILQTIQARKMLLEDPDLMALNIGVMVRNRVATLWGPVPSAESAFRAELCLRTMIELADVRNELFVSDELDDVKLPLKIDNKPIYLPERLPPKLPREPRSFTGRVERVMENEAEIKQMTAAKIKVQPTEALPESVPGMSQPQNEQNKPAEPGDMTDMERKLVSAVRTLLLGNPRYRDVLFAVKDGRVYLKSANQDFTEVHEAAREIARFPEVVGVVILEKTSSR